MCSVWRTKSRCINFNQRKPAERYVMREVSVRLVERKKCNASAFCMRNNFSSSMFELAFRCCGSFLLMDVVHDRVALVGWLVFFIRSWNWIEGGGRKSLFSAPLFIIYKSYHFSIALVTDVSWQHCDWNWVATASEFVERRQLEMFGVYWAILWKLLPLLD